MGLRAAAVALAVLALPWTLAGCGCPTALLAGELVRDGETLAVDVGDGTPRHVRWPFGYGVRSDGAHLVVTDILGSIKAREGDTVRLGGGQVGDDDGTFGVCGDYEVDPA